MVGLALGGCYFATVSLHCMSEIPCSFLSECQHCINIICTLDPSILTDMVNLEQLECERR